MAPVPTLLRLDLPTRPRRKALLAGVRYSDLDKQYPKPTYTLTSTWSDVEHLRNFLTETLSFRPEDIRALTDDRDPQHSDYPSRRNLIQAMEDLVKDVKEGDHLVFHFSGHGSQKPDQDGDEKDGLDEAIWPADVKPGTGFDDAEDVILDDEIKAILVDKVPPGAHLVIILDCCHSGSGADLRHCHKDHLEASEEKMVRDVTHPAHNSRVAVKKIGLKGLTSEKSKTDAAVSPTSSTAENIPVVQVFSPITPATASSLSSASSSSSSSTSASSIFDWSSAAISTPSSATSFDSLEDSRRQYRPKHPVIVSWSACPDPDMTLSLARTGGIFIKAFIDAFHEAENATHEFILHLIKEKMEENIKRAIAQAAQIVAKGSTQSHTPSAPQNYLRDKRKRDRVEKKILASLAEGHQAHPEPMLATNHDYPGLLHIPVAAVFGAFVVYPVQSVESPLESDSDLSDVSEDESS